MRNWTTIKEFEEIKFEYFEGIAKITINKIKELTQDLPSEKGFVYF